MAKIVVDIDGVLTLETKDISYSQRTPNVKNINRVNDLYYKNNVIVLWTARYRRDRYITVKWLKQYGVKYHKLEFNKMRYDFLVDDKAVALEDIV